MLPLLNEGEPQVNEGGNGDKDAHSNQRFENGSGGPRNTFTYVQAIPTPGTSNTNATEPVTLVINEVDADTAGTDTMEFVELFDGGTGNTSLSGFVLVVYNGNGDTSYNAFDLDGFTTNSEGYFVMGNAAVPNVSMIVNSNSLQNGADAVVLYSGDATDFPSGTAVTTANLVDALVYDTNDSDDGLSDSTTTNNLGHLVPITRIVLTGGACAGKTTALATLSVTLEQMGFKVL